MNPWQRFALLLDDKIKLTNNEYYLNDGQETQFQSLPKCYTVFTLHILFACLSTRQWGKEINTHTMYSTWPFLHSGSTVYPIDTPELPKLEILNSQQNDYPPNRACVILKIDFVQILKFFWVIYSIIIVQIIRIDQLIERKKSLCKKINKTCTYWISMYIHSFIYQISISEIFFFSLLS